MGVVHCEIVAPFERDNPGSLARMCREAALRIRLVRCIFEDTETSQGVPVVEDPANPARRHVIATSIEHAAGNSSAARRRSRTGSGMGRGRKRRSEGVIVEEGSHPASVFHTAE